MVLYTDDFWNLQLEIMIGIVWGVAGWLYVRNRNVWKKAEISGTVCFWLLWSDLRSSVFMPIFQSLKIFQSLSVC